MKDALGTDIQIGDKIMYAGMGTAGFERKLCIGLGPKMVRVTPINRSWTTAHNGSGTSVRPENCIVVTELVDASS